MAEPIDSEMHTPVNGVCSRIVPPNAMNLAETRSSSFAGATPKFKTFGVIHSYPTSPFVK